MLVMNWSRRRNIEILEQFLFNVAARVRFVNFVIEFFVR